MIIYLMNIFAMTLCGAILLWYKPTELNKKFFCIVVSLQWILLSGLRHISIGTDTFAYKIYSFDITKNQSWDYLKNNFVDIIFNGASGKDPGYHLLEKLIQIFSVDYQVFLFFIALVFTIPMGIWIYKNSVEPYMSFLIYSCMFSSFFAITGLRQTVATAIVVFIGYKFIRERKLWIFLILVLIAFTVHKSALSFLPFYFIANKKITKKYLLTISISIIFISTFRNQVMITIGNLMGYQQYVNQFEGAGTWTFSILLLLLALITIWKYKILISNNSKTTNYINALLMAFVFVPLTFVDPSAMRVVQYYSIFIILLLPEILKIFPVRERVVFYHIITILLVFLFVKNNPQYIFFWQGW
ncbi:EpsG family protein [Paenibacillus sp. BAC0078]